MDPGVTAGERLGDRSACPGAPADGGAGGAPVERVAARVSRSVGRILDRRSGAIRTLDLRTRAVAGAAGAHRPPDRR